MVVGWLWKLRGLSQSTGNLRARLLHPIFSEFLESSCEEMRKASRKVCGIKVWGFGMWSFGLTDLEL